MKFGFMFFASSEESLTGGRYRLVLESSRFADANDFASIWVPERHFTQFGSLYPNPAVLLAALAASTERVRLMAGSVVAPLHHPLCIAEDWSMVDNLSGGRVGISFAPGWNPDDFVLNPEGYDARQEAMHEAIRVVRHLWSGGTWSGHNGKGEPREVRIYPTPVQSELPVWMTAAGNPETFRKAGAIGANLLTHVLDQNEEQLAGKIRIYREARAAHGFDPSAGSVTAMLHTYVGADERRVREEARVPFCNYIRSNIGLLNGLAQSRGQQVDIRSMPAKQLDEFINFLYERFAQSRGLIGTPEGCIPLVRKLEAIGVDEIACLLDFGPPVASILENLPHLARLQAMAAAQPEPRERWMDLVAVRERCTERVPAPKPHSSQSEPATSNAEALWRGQEESLARVSVQSDAVQARLLDLCPDVLAAALGWERKEWFMSGFDAFRRHREVAGSEFWIHAVSTTEGTGTVRVADASGNVLCEIEGMHLETAARALKHQTQREGAQNEADHRNLLYRREWTPVELRPKPGNAGAWLIFADRAGLSAQLAAELQAAGATCKLIFDAPVLGKVEVQLKTDTALRGVLYLRSLDLPPEDVSLRKQIGADVLAIIQALASSGTESSPRLWVVTSGAMPVLSEERTSVAQTPVWGLGQAIAAEHPQLWGGLLDLAPEPALRDHDARNVWSAIEGAGDEHMLALRGQQAYALRIVRDTESLAHSGPAQRPLQLDGDATYLVTGRLGGLGMHLATRLRERGARHIALLGRSEPLRVSGHDSFFRCDLSDFESTDAAIREIERTLPPLKGVFHLAGTLDDGLLLHQDPERFHASGTGKAEGAWNLHKATESSPLDYFVMYSTVATLLTVPGQGSYAAANIVLDALAHRRRAEGKPALCVNWGPWEQLGMTATNYGRAANERLAAAGIAPLDPELALDLLEQLLGAKTTQSAVARINWARLFAGDPRSAISPLLSAFRLESAAAASEAPVQQETELTRKLRACPRTDRPDLLRATLAGMLAESLRLPDAIAPSQSFFDLGVDSILALEFTNRLSVALGRSFPGTLLFTSPTVGALADRLLDEMAAVLGGSEQGTSHPEQPPAPATSVPAPSPDETANEEELSRLIAEEISSR